MYGCSRRPWPPPWFRDGSDSFTNFTQIARDTWLSAV